MESTKGWWNRKFHIEKEMPDGNIYKGFINVCADTENELYKREEIKGDFWVKKTKEGWDGLFWLDGGRKSDLRKTIRLEIDDYVLTTGVFRKTVSASIISSTLEAESILNSLRAVKYEETPLLCGRLEDCIVSEETHFWRHTR